MREGHFIQEWREFTLKQNLQDQTPAVPLARQQVLLWSSELCPGVWVAPLPAGAQVLECVCV